MILKLSHAVYSDGIFLGTNLVATTIRANSFVFRGSGSTTASQSDLLKLLRSLSFYHFSSITTTTTLQVVVTVATNVGTLSAFASFLRVRPTRMLNCSLPVTRDRDVVLLLDASASLSPHRWSQLTDFWGEVLEKLPVSSRNIRYDAFISLISL